MAWFLEGFGYEVLVLALLRAVVTMKKLLGLAANDRVPVEQDWYLRPVFILMGWYRTDVALLFGEESI